MLTRKSLEKLLGEEGKHLIYPKDKQNVPSATKFMLLFEEQLEGGLPYNLLPIKSLLLMLAEVFRGVLCLFVFIDQSLEDQLLQVSCSAYILFFLYRKYKTKLMPSQHF